MHKRNFFELTVVAVTIALLPLKIMASELPYGLKDGKPFAGTKLNILSVVTPQFDGLMLRDDEFTKLTKRKWKPTSMNYSIELSTSLQK